MLSITFFTIFQIARKISARVDDVVRSMYPPLDPRLLEARAAALTSVVIHLALIARYECGQRARTMAYIDKALAEMETHLLVSANCYGCIYYFCCYGYLL